MKNIKLLILVMFLLVSSIPYSLAVAQCVVPYGISTDLRPIIGVNEPIQFRARVQSQIGSPAGISVQAILVENGVNISRSPLEAPASVDLVTGLSPILSFDPQPTTKDLTIRIVASEIRGEQIITYSKDFPIKIGRKLKIVPSALGLLFTNTDQIIISYSIVDASTNTAPMGNPIVSTRVSVNNIPLASDGYSDRVQFRVDNMIGAGLAIVDASLQGYIPDEQNITFSVRAPDKSGSLIIGGTPIENLQNNIIDTGVQKIGIVSTFDGKTPRPIDTVTGTVKRPDGGTDVLSFISGADKSKWTTSYDFKEPAKAYTIDVNLIKLDEPGSIKISYTLATLGKGAPGPGGEVTSNIVYIIIGVVVGVILLIGIILFLAFRKRRK